ncbi:sterol carrier protein [Natronomonas marina]|jgi:putative sterol carrier protein|uniref:sterol carrier protein n=1 Tax=Natronomonas marina TaxID=2961939 RepID=UPI0020C96780|nr:sterol carrier protein [Natronomonas marina]
MPYFPTEAWLEAYRRRLNDSEAFADLGAGWARGFDGDVRYVITDLPVETTTLGDLPPGVLDGLPDHVRERVADVPLAEAPAAFDPIREGLPDDVVDRLDQLERYAVDGTVHAHVGLEDGRCTDVEVLESPDEREAGFVLRGSYDVWRSIVDGRPSSSAVLSGDLAFEGNRVRRLRYAPMFGMLGDAAADVETTHLFPAEETPSQPVLDTAMRGRSLLERQVHRRVKRTVDLL